MKDPVRDIIPIILTTDNLALLYAHRNTLDEADKAWYILVVMINIGFIILQALDNNRK